MSLWSPVLRPLLILSLVFSLTSSDVFHNTSCSLDLAQEEAIGSQIGLPPCKNVLELLRHAHRHYRNGPIEMTSNDSTQCQIHWFSASEACSFLSKPKPTMILFVGDSMSRHFMHSFQHLLRGDPVLGAMREDTPREVMRNCSCDLQFVSKACRAWVLWDSQNLTKQPCPGGRIVYMEALHDGQVIPKEIADLVESHRSEGGRSVIVLGGYGLHNLLQAKPIFNTLIHPLWELIKPNLGKDVSVIVLSVHSLQDNVLEKYRENMNNRRVSQYNTLMARLCRQSLPSIPFFDTFSITSQSDSFDGVHYGFKVNLLKAQLLLSVINEVFV